MANDMPTLRVEWPKWPAGWKVSIPLLLRRGWRINPLVLSPVLVAELAQLRGRRSWATTDPEWLAEPWSDCERALVCGAFSIQN